MIYSNQRSLIGGYAHWLGILLYWSLIHMSIILSCPWLKLVSTNLNSYSSFSSPNISFISSKMRLFSIKSFCFSRSSLNFFSRSLLNFLSSSSLSRISSFDPFPSSSYSSSSAFSSFSSFSSFSVTGLISASIYISGRGCSEDGIDSRSPTTISPKSMSLSHYSARTASIS